MAQLRRGSGRRFSRSWIILAILYGAFFYWYTSFEGPLTAEEIVHYTEVVRSLPGSDAATEQRWVEFMESDTGDDWAMWNAIDLADPPKPIKGVPPGATSEEVVNLYAEPFFMDALSRAAHPAIGGTAAAPALDIWGMEGGDEWDSGLLVRYRSRRDLMQTMEGMLASGEEIHDFKIAALNKTIAFPLDPWVNPGDPRILLGLVFLIIALVFQLRCTAART